MGGPRTTGSAPDRPPEPLNRRRSHEPDHREQAGGHDAAGTRQAPQRAAPRGCGVGTLTGLIFAAPLIVYLLLFYAYPLAVNVSMSLRRFTRATYVTGEAPFAGADIYKEVLASPQFWPTVEHTAIFVVVSLVFQYTIGLALAVFFHQNFPLSTVLRALFLVPWLLPLIVSASTWPWMLDSDSGILNRFLGLFGVDPVWLAHRRQLAVGSVIIANIWLGIPFNLVILYCGPAEHLRRTSTRPPRSTARAPGSGSGASPSRCCARSPRSPCCSASSTRSRSSTSSGS